MNKTREFTPIEQAVTDLVTQFSKIEDCMAQATKLEDFIEHILTARELLLASSNPLFIKSTRLEMIGEATNLVSITIKELGDKRLLESLERLRIECAEEFIKVTEEKTLLPSRALGVDEKVLEC